MSTGKELIIILAPIFIILFGILFYAIYRIIISENEIENKTNKVMKYQRCLRGKNFMENFCKEVDKVEKNADRLVCQYRKRK